MLFRCFVFCCIDSLTSFLVPFFLFTGFYLIFSSFPSALEPRSWAFLIVAPKFHYLLCCYRKKKIGWHRTGAAFKRGLPTLKAVVL